MARRKANSGTARKATAPRLHRYQEAWARGLAAINDVRRGKYKTVTAAARSEGITVAFIKRTFPGALYPSKPGKRLRVRPSDRYSALVEILDNSGTVVHVVAHGSRERELAGQHRAAYLAVLDNKQPSSVLRQFRGKKVGGKKLLTNPNRLFELGQGGVTDDLLPLYVSPEASV